MASEQPPAKVRRISNNITNNCRYKFELEQTIGNEDYLSNLPDDCLREIYSFFNHVDLNALFAVNQKMHRVASKARPNAKKGVVEEMNIVKVNNDEYTITIIFNQNTIITDRVHSREIDHGYCEFCKAISIKIHPQRIPLSVIHTVFQRMWRLPTRYDFNSVKFDTMLFDHAYFAVCRFLFRVSSKRRIFSNAAIDRGLLDPLDLHPLRTTYGLYGYARGHSFHNWMIDGCLEELVLTAYQLEHFDLCQLLKSFAKAVTAPSIRIESTRLPKQIDRFANLQLLDQFVNCINFHVEYLVFEANSFMRAIIQRSQKGRAGLWQILISRAISLGFISDAIPLGMAITTSPQMADGSFVVFGSNRETIMRIKQLNEYMYPDLSNKLFSVSVIFYD